MKKKTLNYFWGFPFGYLALIALIEVVLHIVLRMLENDWTFPALWHLTGWGSWLMMCLAAQVYWNKYIKLKL